MPDDDSMLGQGTVDERTEARVHALRGERPYPHSPLASRKAPEGRLFLVDGSPSMVREQRRVVRESERMLKVIDHARGELVEAIARDDADVLVAVANRFLAIGAMFAGRVRTVGEPS